MARMRGLAAFAVLVLILGCAPAIPSAGPTGSAPSQASNVAANPLAVHVHLDASASRGAKLPASGGTVTADEGGVSASLSVPEGSLAAPTEVTMTPVAAVDGLPFSGGIIAAVSLAPNGVALVGPAALTFRVTQPAGPGIVGFAYRDDGSDFHLFPVAVAGQSVVLEVSHFSGYGVAKATMAEVASLVARAPDSPGDAEEAGLGQVLNAMKPAGPDATDLQTAEADACRFYDAAAGPALTAAESNEDLLDGAIRNFIGWMRQNTLLGLTGCTVDRTSTGLASAGRGLDNAIKKAEDRCRTLHEPTHALTMLKRARQATLIGVGSSTDIADRVGRSCLSFNLELDSSITAFDERGTTITMRVTAKVELAPEFGGEVEWVCEGSTLVVVTGNPPRTTRTCVGDLVTTNVGPPTTKYRGVGKLEYVSLSVPNPPHCSVSTNPQGADLHVIAGIEWDREVGDDPRLIAMKLIPAAPSENIVFTCHGITPPPANGAWFASFLAANRTELVGSKSASLEAGFRDWQIVREGPLYAKSSVKRSPRRGGARVTEINSVLELRLVHVPK